MTSAAPRDHLRSLQALRGVAAGAVVFEHLHFHSELRQGPGLVPEWFAAGHLGVDLFFVLSGFILLHVHRGDLGRPGRVGPYAWRRFVRVWPLLALLSTLKLAYLLLGGHGASPHKTELSVIATSYLLLPHPDWPLLDVAWTLRHEALFYALFGLAVWGGSRLGLGLCAAAAAGLLCVSLAGGTDGWPWWAAFLGTPLHWHFLFGLAVADLARRPLGERLLRPVAAALWLSASAAALLLGAAWHLETGRDEPRILFALGSAALVLWLVPAERRRPLPIPRWLAQLGDASYSLYLWHGFVIVAALTPWAHLPTPIQAWPRLFLAGVAALSFASSLALYRWVERPLLSALKR